MATLLVEIPTILFVGSNPSNASKVDEAFYGETQSSRVLAEWSKGIKGCKMHVNVLNKKTPKNRPLKRAEVKLNLDQLKENIRCIGPHKVVALGKTAARALTLLRVDFFEMPHPSGRNRLNNNKIFIEKKIKELTEYCQSTPLPSSTT